MINGLVDYNWDDIENYNNSQISYFLFLEGKSIDVISKIRNISREETQRHIIDGKIKYRFLAKSKNLEELLNVISKAGKNDKQLLLSNLDEKNREALLDHIRNNYVEMHSKDKETAIWLVGELRDINSKDILIKASVHKFVNVRRMAVSAMGKIDDKIFENALRRALEDENPQVISYALKALIKMKNINSKDKVQKLLAASDKEYIKKLCEEYLNGEMI
jgi:hypothetical protein